MAQPLQTRKGARGAAVTKPRRSQDKPRYRVLEKRFRCEVVNLAILRAWHRWLYLRDTASHQPQVGGRIRGAASARFDSLAPQLTDLRQEMRKTMQLAVVITDNNIIHKKL